MSLTIAHLKKSYGEDTILQDISFHIDTGESVALMGTSGSGKSTLAKCIARLESMSGGQILYKGENILKIKESVFRKNIQYVFQDQLNALNPAKRVKDLLMSVCRRFSIKEDLAQILQNARLAPALLDRFPRELSGGERQRLGVARAMLVKPQVLLLDEITSALDKRLKHEIMEVLMDYKKKFEISMICITHDRTIAQKYFSRQLVIDKGRLIKDEKS
ncbi:dipeptide/oligopeptide/nickel ABC transporter ATP-binding protein [Helicobacter baculiformis]|uniref:Dipeptide/oligopeptide/nickel ABC transporter ATP-binding protein n=1 Tax=Helicobacter baculiformis TaxID=427351 RepID=A0ABV7ZJH0_9HELI|nr:dipeptide/oligopeptide/nickel ABC transporter ATP-binding protein [Helicobacter baculiformis]